MWPTHPTNSNYKTQLLKSFDYLFGFVSLNKHSFKIVINKKWLENQNNLEENEYKSPTIVYYKEIDMMVPLRKIGL
jgi:hypothetical protein